VVGILAQAMKQHRPKKAKAGGTGFHAFKP
jgi:hypothetical protein